METDRELIEQLEIPQSIAEEFRVGWQVRAALAVAKQARINAVCQRLETRQMEGIGELTHRIDPDVYWAMRHKFGPDCWKDKKFLRDCELKGLVCRMRSRPDKLTVRV
jgi:hypothetical protein